MAYPRRLDRVLAEDETMDSPMPGCARPRPLQQPRGRHMLKVHDEVLLWSARSPRSARAYQAVDVACLNIRISRTLLRCPGTTWESCSSRAAVVVSCISVFLDRRPLRACGLRRPGEHAMHFDHVLIAQAQLAGWFGGSSFS